MISTNHKNSFSSSTLQHNTLSKLVGKYVFFAIIATIANLSAQFMVIEMINLPFYPLYSGILVGTLIGLLVKYYLDKHYIFYFHTKSKRQDMKKFIIYSTMGVLTTLIFWFFELSFNYLFATLYAKYVGAIIGLSIGYVTKYNLDKRFVFNEHQ